MIIKARKKPIEIEAVQYTGKNKNTIVKFVKQSIINTTTVFGIKTLEGIMNIDINDYVIKGVKGEFYPCKPDIFLASYDIIPNYIGIACGDKGCGQELSDNDKKTVDAFYHTVKNNKPYVDLNV